MAKSLYIPRHWSRCRWRLLATCLTCTVLAVYTTCGYEPSQLSEILQPPPPQTPRPVTVLLWWEPFGKQQQLGDCQLLFNISSCNVMVDRNRYWQAEAVIFHHRDLGYDLPAERPAGQRWIWMNFESPSHSPLLEGLDGIFNWTMSYKLSSDIFLPYGYLYAHDQEVTTLRLPRKSKLLAWVISHWNEEHERVRYYWQLTHYVKIDVYGRNGLPLLGDSVLRTVSHYKFYLAFENSQHPDYITEKLWRNAFESSAVPVVLGPSRANYELFMPGDSFIHVDDFASPRKLAQYLKFLDKNPVHYLRYFAWRKHYQVHVVPFWNEHFCTVCKAVRAAGDQVKTVYDLASWFES